MPMRATFSTNSTARDGDDDEGREEGGGADDAFPSPGALDENKEPRIPSTMADAQEAQQGQSDTTTRAIYITIPNKKERKE